MSSTLPRGLDGEFVVDIADGESLTVHSADGDTPLLFRSSGQLGDVASRLESNTGIEKEKPKTSYTRLVVYNFNSTGRP